MTVEAVERWRKKRVKRRMCQAKGRDFRLRRARMKRRVRRRSVREGLGRLLVVWVRVVGRRGRREMGGTRRRVVIMRRRRSWCCEDEGDEGAIVERGEGGEPCKYARRLTTKGVGWSDCLWCGRSSAERRYRSQRCVPAVCIAESGAVPCRHAGRRSLIASRCGNVPSASRRGLWGRASR